MPYNEWKTLKHVLDGISNSSRAEIYYSTKDKQIEMCLNAPPCKFVYSVEDNSFGQYLFFYVSRKLYGNTDVSISVEKNNDYKNIKEDNKMKFNFDFGPVSGNTVRMSMYGLAVKNKSGTWVSYDAKSGDVMDVDVFNFDGAKFLYKMPVAIKDIAIGDIIVHHNAPMFVVGVPADGKAVIAVDPIAGERKEIMLTKSPFGFNFVTKVVNFLGNVFNTSATAENPFGNMWMAMAMTDENRDMNDILPFLMLNNATPGIDNNVLMFMALSNTKNGSKDILPWLLMMNTQHPAPAVPSQGCTCGGHCTDSAHEA